MPTLTSSRSIACAPIPVRNMPKAFAAVQRKFDTEWMPRWQGDWGGSSLLCGLSPSKDAIRLDGNDYLSISGHPQILAAQMAGLTLSSNQVVQSGAFHRDDNPSRHFERSLGAWLGFPDTMLCQSGYMANVGLIQALADVNTPVYIDMMAHMSLWEGVQAAKATAYPFRHNDPQSLASQIARHGAGLVIVDSVYSTTGALCPLEAIVQVCEQTGCMSLVDESHSLGTHGPQGRGLCAALELTHRVDFITASLAKAFSARAGFFTLPKLAHTNEDALRIFFGAHSHPNVFSSSLLPQEIASLQATLCVIQQSDYARSRLAAHTQRLRNSLTQMGYPVQQGSEQIIALEAGPESQTLQLRNALEKEGVFGAVFFAPATSRNRSMVRLTLNAGLTDHDITHIEQACQRIAPQIQPWLWPCAQRQNGQNARASEQALAGSLWSQAALDAPTSTRDELGEIEPSQDLVF